MSSISRRIMNEKHHDIKVPTEVYSRVAGFYRPVSSWNKGKREEFRQRKEYKIPEGLDDKRRCNES